MQQTYCIDSSALSDGWVRYYKPRVHKSLWQELLPRLLTDDRLIAPVEVRLEIEALGGGLFDWVCKYSDELFREQTEQTQGVVNLILQRFPNFLPTRSYKEWADPWVIATAKELGCVVVTGEKLAGAGQNEPPRIPDICLGIKVKCMHTNDEPTPGLYFMMEAEDWKF